MPTSCESERWFWRVTIEEAEHVDIPRLSSSGIHFDNSCFTSVYSLQSSGMVSVACYHSMLLLSNRSLEGIVISFIDHSLFLHPCIVGFVFIAKRLMLGKVLWMSTLMTSYSNLCISSGLSIYRTFPIKTNTPLITLTTRGRRDHLANTRSISLLVHKYRHLLCAITQIITHSKVVEVSANVCESVL